MKKEKLISRIVEIMPGILGAGMGPREIKEKLQAATVETLKVQLESLERLLERGTSLGAPDAKAQERNKRMESIRKQRANILVGMGNCMDQISGQGREFAVVLEDVGADRDRVVRVIRELTGLRLRAARELLNSAPMRIRVGKSLIYARRARAKLKDAGATPKAIEKVS